MVINIKLRLIRLFCYFISKLSNEPTYKYIIHYNKFKKRTVEIIITKAKPLQ